MKRNSIPLPADSVSLLQNLEELVWLVDNALGKKTIQMKKDLRLLMLASNTAAMHRIARAVVVGIRGGSVDGIDILTRSIVEGLINTKYILEDETQMRTRAYITHDYKDRIEALGRLIPLLERGVTKGMAMVTDAERYKKLKYSLESELKQLEKKFGKENLIWPSLKQRAKLCKAEELYATAFWLLSLDAHMTARGLDRYMREKKDGGIVIELGQDLSRLYMHLRTIYISYLALLNENCNYFGLPTRDELKKYDFIPQ